MVLALTFFLVDLGIDFSLDKAVFLATLCQLLAFITDIALVKFLFTKK